MNVCVRVWVYKCVLALVILHTNRIFSARHYGVSCGLLGSTEVFTLSHKRHDFREKN